MSNLGFVTDTNPGAPHAGVRKTATGAGLRLGAHDDRLRPGVQVVGGTLPGERLLKREPVEHCVSLSQWKCSLPTTQTIQETSR